MNISRVVFMTRKDITLTTRESFFLWMIIMPIIMTLVLNAALGSVGAEKPSLAVYGEGDIVSTLEKEISLRVAIFSSEEDLQEAVLKGEYDAGLLVSSRKLLISGKSLLNERLTIEATLMNAFRELSSGENPVTLETKLIGKEGLSLKIRLIPFLLIISAVIGGLIISASLIEEREKKTLNAVLVTPITPLEVIASKSIFGLFLGLILSALILILNNSFGDPLVLLFLFLGTLFTVGLGLIAGVVMDNITDLIARMKIFNLFLQFPAFVILFPQIPQWIGKFFPTYYFVEPIISITQKGAGLSDVWWMAVVLVLCDILVLILASKVLKERMLGKEII
ncbi:MAG: ABC transporter permease [Candidatus Methanofastidiosia archaeon]